jgi:hypothetical protein
MYDDAYVKLEWEHSHLNFAYETKTRVKRYRASHSLMTNLISAVNINTMVPI